MKRREFIAGSIAVGAYAASPAFAYDNTIAKEPPIPEILAPRVVNIKGGAPGEVHVVPDHYSLYLMLEDNKAIRYYVGVGRDSLYESGSFYVGAKKKWPSWTPTPDMIERDPKSYKQFEDGMPGGPSNPLGARALYLFYPDRGDSFLRIHGTNKPKTIGLDVSNGCARLVNAHMVDLYQRVQMKSKVVLHPKGLYPKRPIGSDVTG
ncbi:L,D-transpeptidase [Neptunicoccus sediminis]|uniref:L,D-transpeptidase n=1 Tax=Neptunicoccus sediminis TaxID=1892596 RepID=UPI0008461944|nr:L,D-transpeptidase [Neptunicoccus sediminis]